MVIIWYAKCISARAILCIELVQYIQNALTDSATELEGLLLLSPGINIGPHC